jgi:alpha-N-arabinofuranosidase
MNAQITLHASQARQTISRHIYGHFAEHLGRCIYDGIWVGPASPIPNINGFRKDVVEALKALKIPNLRWPGGCFADDYHWRDGIGPRSKRPRTVNIHWGNYVEDNSFGTHEFMDLCELLGADAYVAFNVGSANPAEMRAWIEYMTFEGHSTLADERRANGRDKPWKLPFVGIGNENWGCGGNMTPEYYTNLHNQFHAYAREFSGNKFIRVACGPNSEDYRWAEVLMANARHLQGMSWHYYTIHPNWTHKGSALDDAESAWHNYFASALVLDRILTRGSAILDGRDPENHVGIYFDEWGTWHRTEPGDTALYQQNTIRDALVASISLDLFNRHARRVRMANIAQTVNVLQSMILTEVGGANRMVLTPTYHVFEMYKRHMDAAHIPLDLTADNYIVEGKVLPSLSASASRSVSGEVTVTLSNLHAHEAQDVSINTGTSASKLVDARVLAGASLNDHNSFDKPDQLKPKPLAGVSVAGGTVKLSLPPRSVAVVCVA